MYSAQSTQIFSALGADWFRSWMYLKVSVTALDICSFSFEQLIKVWIRKTN
jgi:hypothetical protein